MSHSSKAAQTFMSVIYVFILSKLQGWCSTKENDRLMAIVFKKKIACDLLSHCWEYEYSIPLYLIYLCCE